MSEFLNIVSSAFKVYGLVVLPQNSYVDSLTPNVMVLGDGALWRLLGPKGEALLECFYAFIKETPKSSLVLFCHVRTQQEDSCP